MPKKTANVQKAGKAPAAPKKAPKKKKRKGFSQAAINRGRKHDYATLHSQYTGYHSVQIERVLKRAMTDRPTQFLTHLATALKAWYSEISSKSEIEIQVAIFDDDRMIIGSNKNETAQLIYDEIVKTEASRFFKTVALEALNRAARSKAADARRIDRHSAKLGRALAGERDDDIPLLEDLEQEGKDICVQFDASDDVGASFADFLNGTGAMKGKYVAIMTSSVNMHAEQKILLAMCKATSKVDRNASVLISGTFRPCRGCYESLTVVQKYGYPNLQFGARPGHAWTTTSKAHVQMLELLQHAGLLTPSQIESDFDEDGLLIGLTNTSYRPVLRTWDDDETDDLHYGTESESEEEWDDDLQEALKED